MYTYLSRQGRRPDRRRRRPQKLQPVDQARLEGVQLDQPFRLVHTRCSGAAHTPLSTPGRCACTCRGTSRTCCCPDRKVGDTVPQVAVLPPTCFFEGHHLDIGYAVVGLGAGVFAGLAVYAFIRREKELYFLSPSMRSPRYLSFLQFSCHSGQRDVSLCFAAFFSSWLHHLHHPHPRAHADACQVQLPGPRNSSMQRSHFRTVIFLPSHRITPVGQTIANFCNRYIFYNR